MGLSVYFVYCTDRFGTRDFKSVNSLNEQEIALTNPSVTTGNYYGITRAKILQEPLV